MAALTAVTPTNAGTAVAGAAVAASDTISQEIIGSKGAILEIINGNAGADTMTISDHGSTPAGNALAGNTIAASVAAGTQKVFVIRPQQVNPATGVVTVTHNPTATITYKLYSLAAL